MGICLGIQGIVEDGRYAKMLEVRKICEELKIDEPKEVYNFFEKLEEGNVIAYGSSFINTDIKHGCVELFNEDGKAGYLIDLSRLPCEFKKLKVFLDY